MSHGHRSVHPPQALLEEVQQSLLAEAAAFRDANIVDVATYDELKAAVTDGKWARGPWAGPLLLSLLCCPTCFPPLFCSL